MARSSQLEWLMTLDPATCRACLRGISEDRLEKLRTDWRFWAHDGQMPPDGDWHTWLIMAGRGYGKTRAGAEWVREIAENDGAARIALVASSLGQVS